MRGQAAIGDILQQTLRRLGLERRLREQFAIAAWSEAVGPTVAAHSWAETVRDGVLLVATDTAAWAQELSLRWKERALERITVGVGPGIIRDIHFRSAGRRPSAGRTRESGRPPDRFPPIAPADEARVQRIVADVETADLRAAMTRALRALLAARGARERQGWRRCPRCRQLHRRRTPVCEDCRRARLSAADREIGEGEA
jgi:hypothetical protein